MKETTTNSAKRIETKTLAHFMVRKKQNIETDEKSHTETFTKTLNQFGIEYKSNGHQLNLDISLFIANTFK
jgi:hypothetical protein